MPRAANIKEWIGETDDARAPKRVRDRLRDKHPTCYLCSRPFDDGKKVALDHVIALINGGENREGNLRPVHIACHAEKTRADVAKKAKVAARRQKDRRIVDAPKMKPGSLMPSMGKGIVDPKTRGVGALTDQQIADIVAYLQALK